MIYISEKSWRKGFILHKRLEISKTKDTTVIKIHVNYTNYATKCFYTNRGDFALSAMFASKVLSSLVFPQITPQNPVTMTIDPNKLPKFEHKCQRYLVNITQEPRVCLV